MTAAVTPVKLYVDLLSQPCRALYILFKITKLPHQLCEVALAKGEHLTEEFKTTVSRFQKVPCIVANNGFKLAESIAILRYLKRTTNCIPDSLYPADTEAQARVDEYLEWQHNNARLLCARYFQMLWLWPKWFGRVTDAAQVADMKTRMEACLDVIENVWLAGDSQYLVGDHLTVADIWAICELEQPRMAGYDPRTGRPKLTAWWKRVQLETSPFYEEAHDVVNKIIASPATN